jgi:hypothetical protein
MQAGRIQFGLSTFVIVLGEQHPGMTESFATTMYCMHCLRTLLNSRVIGHTKGMLLCTGIYHIICNLNHVCGASYIIYG